MEPIFIYFLKSSGLIITFFAAYYFLLRKETFFTTNRWFLLSGLILSVVLPLFFIKKVVLVEVPKVVPNILNSKINAVSTNEIIEKSQQIDWFQIGLYVYGIIAVFFLLKIIFNLISLYKILNNKIVIKESKFQFIDTDENISPFSFFNYIVFNSKMYSESELNSILLHEKIHSSQKHSVDVIITNLFSVIFWFNPFMHLYKKAVIQNLEYIADSEAINQIDDAKSYQMALLKVVSNQNCLPITNHFYQSLIKKRIIMLNTNQSHRKNSWKYAVVFPVLFAFVFLFQVKVIAQEKFITLDDGSSISSNSREVADYSWTKNSSDEEFKNDSEIAMASGIVFDFSDILRNSKGEITNITVSYSDNLGNVFAKTFSGKKGIDPIHFVRDIDFNGKGSVGFVDDKSTSQKIVKESKKEIKVNKQKPVSTQINTVQNNKITESGSNTISKTQTKTTVITNTNGDDIVFMNDNISIKVPSHPTITATETEPILIINGIEQKNPKATLEILDITKIKQLKVLDENNKETSGTVVKKMIITTK